MHTNRICPSCMESAPGNTALCPICGWKFPKSSEEAPKKLSQADKNIGNTDLQRQNAQNDKNDVNSAEFSEKSALKSTKKPISMSNLLQPGIRRPWICRTTRQIVILVRDSSGSMEDENKAEQATKATQELVRELARPENKDGFYVSVIDFSEEAAIMDPLQKATELDGDIISIEPFWGTNITSGLEKALSMLQKAEKITEEGIHYLRSVVLLFTDGMHNVGVEPNATADCIKEIADLVTVAYGSDADEKLLRYLASTSQHCYKCRNGKNLRQFLAAVGQTMTSTMSAGTNATKALGKIRTK